MSLNSLLVVSKSVRTIQSKVSELAVAVHAEDVVVDIAVMVAVGTAVVGPLLPPLLPPLFPRFTITATAIPIANTKHAIFGQLLVLPRSECGQIS